MTSSCVPSGTPTVSELGHTPLRTRSLKIVSRNETLVAGYFRDRRDVADLADEYGITTAMVRKVIQAGMIDGRDQAFPPREDGVAHPQPRQRYAALRNLDRLRNPIGSRLATYRVYRTQATLTAVAEFLDVDRTTLRSWELGVREPSPPELERIARLLDVDEAELLARPAA